MPPNGNSIHLIYLVGYSIVAVTTNSTKSVPVRDRLIYLGLGSKNVKSAGLMLEPVMTHQAGAYPGFYSIKQLGVELPLDRMLVHCRLPSQLILVPIYTVE